MEKKSVFKGYFYGCISAISYGMIPLFTLPLMQEGMTYPSILFYRYVFGFLSLLALMLLKRDSFKLYWREVPVLLVMAVLFALSSIYLFKSYTYMAAGIASTILFMYPIFVAVIMSLFYKEKINWVTVVSILLAFVGISMLYKGDGEETLSLMGIACVVFSALAYAIYIVGIEKSRLKVLNSVRLTFYVVLIGTLMFWAQVDFGSSLQPLPDWGYLANVLFLGIFPTTVSLVTLVLSAHHIGSTAAAILGALEPVTAVFFGVLVFHEPFTLNLMMGMLLVISAVLLIVWKKKQ